MIYEQNEDFGDESEIEMTQEEFEAHKAACEELLEKAKAASKLADDPNFKSIIMEDYFTKEPKRLGSLMASGKLTKQGFDGAVEDLRSIGHLRSFLTDYISKGNIAKDELDQLEIARQEAIMSADPI